MFERFTAPARGALQLAQDEARRAGAHGTGTEHLLLGLLAEGENVAAQVLTRMGVTVDAIRRPPPAGPDPVGVLPFTDRAKKTLELALREALQLGHNYIGPEHMLLGIVREGAGGAAAALGEIGLHLTDVRREVIASLGGARPEPSAQRGEDMRKYLDRLRQRADEYGAMSDRRRERLRELVAEMEALITEENEARCVRTGSQWFIDAFTKWSFVLNETQGTAITISGDFTSRTKQIAQLVGSDLVVVDATGQGFAAAEMLKEAGVNVVRVKRTAL